LMSLLRDGIPWLSANSLMSRSSCSLIRTCTIFLPALKISPAHPSTARIDLARRNPALSGPRPRETRSLQPIPSDQKLVDPVPDGRKNYACFLHRRRSTSN
jgi:hypothetical protein